MVPNLIGSQLRYRAYNATPMKQPMYRIKHNPGKFIHIALYFINYKYIQINYLTSIMQSFLAIKTTRYHNWSGTKITSCGPRHLISMFFVPQQKDRIAVETTFCRSRPRMVFLEKHRCITISKTPSTIQEFMKKGY